MTTTLFFIPGLGADERSFKRQLSFFENAEVVSRIPIRSNETLEEFALRLADSLPPVAGDCIVIGHSMGGMLAPYFAKRLNAKAVILISSVRSPADFPRWYRMFNPIVQHANWLLRGGFVVFRTILRLTFPVLKHLYSDARIEVMKQLFDTDAWRFGQSVRIIFAWGYGKNQSSAEYDFPIWQICGDHDHVLPLVPGSADCVVPHSGHLLPITHPEEVNQFIQEILMQSQSNRKT